MNTTINSSQDTDLLTELQLQVARRADQLAAILSYRTPLNLPCWLQAEEELLGQFRRLGDANQASTARTASAPSAGAAYIPA